MKQRRAGCLGAASLLILLIVGYVAFISAQAPNLHRNTQLLRAIERHDSARALALLQEGASPNTRQSALHRTVWQTLFELLGGRPPSRTDPTAFSLACGDSWTLPLSTAVIEEMIKRGADVHVKDADGFPPLFNALNSGNDALALALVRGGADWRNLPLTATPPVELAIRNGNTALLEEMLTRGADPNQRNAFHKTPLGQALDLPEPKGEMRLKILTALLAHGADVNAIASYDHVPLAAAAQRNQFPETRLLLEHGADINKADEQGNTPLMIQIPSSNEEMTQFLLAHGANVDPINNSGQTALMIACASWPAPDIIVPDLLKHGADTNVRDRQGDTALIVACRWEGAEPRMIAQLLAHGADASLRNAKGETALTCALAHSPDPETVRLLRQALTKSGKRTLH